MRNYVGDVCVNIIGALGRCVNSGIAARIVRHTVARSTVASVAPDTRPEHKAPPVQDHLTDASIVTAHVKHDLQKQGDSIICTGCDMSAKKPKGYNDAVGQAYRAWDKDLR